MAHAAWLAVLLLGGCTSSPKQVPLADLPQSPVTTEGTQRTEVEAAASTPQPVQAVGSSAGVTGEIHPMPSSTQRPKTSAGSLETAMLRDQPVTSRAPDPVAGSSGPSANEPDQEDFRPSATYEDAAGDANGTGKSGPLSQPSFDILRVEWTPVSYEEVGRRGYSTSITIAGPAREDGMYVSLGFFPSDVRGEQCQLYHFLAVGAPAFANAFCGSISAGTRRLVGRINGRTVTSGPTASGGTTLVGTFDDPIVPSQLEAADRRLDNLSAFTTLCSGPSPNGCASTNTVDLAISGRTFRV